VNSSDTQTDQERITDLMARAEAGNAEAQFQLGCCYDAGDGVEQDDKLAALWFKRAAQQDHHEATYYFADALCFGRGVQEDKQKAFTYYLKGANFGNVPCMYSVGYSYFYGDGVEEDKGLGYAWYERGAQLGNDLCMHALGRVYEYGTDSVPVDRQKAREWYEKAARAGNMNAMCALGRWYEHTDYPDDNDPLEALYWYKKGAEAGNADCMNEYGRMLGWSEGVQKNTPEAIRWLRRAAIKASNYAAVNLCLLLHDEPEETAYWMVIDGLLDLESSTPVELIGDAYVDMAKRTGRKENWSMAAFFYNESRRRGQSSWTGLEEAYQKCLDNGGSLAEAHNLIAMHQLDDLDVIEGQYFMPFDPTEPPIQRENMPVPQAVREEMGESFEPERPPSQTDSLPEHTQQMQQPQQPQRAAEARAPRGDVSQLKPGSLLAEKYLIESVLGKGGMAVVFKAKQMLMDRVVAIKMMLPEVAKDESTVQRFQREAMNASKLRHPNVITIYDFGVSPEGMPFMVMDYLQGDSLENLIEREGAIRPERAVEMLLQVCDALAAAHQEQIIHRDIKPSNIMVEVVRGKEHVKLVDFGIAKAIGDQDAKQQQKLTKTGEVFGSLVYMSPEQCMGKPLDSRSDIYAFGCVLYEILVGQPPFIGDTVFETMSKHIYDDPPGLPLGGPQGEQLENIFRKCVAKAPESRYQTMEEIKNALLQISQR
jgi:TPR repeat protein/tRNA A-37 threonylcarbamoyl transferase component Bud32